MQRSQYHSQALRFFDQQAIDSWCTSLPGQTDLQESFAENQQAFAACPKAEYGVELFCVEYKTAGLDGAEVSATGLAMLPKKEPNLGPCPVLCLQQQTIFDLHDAPSLFITSRLAKMALPLFAAQGYVVLLADYIGQGMSAVAHPYMHAKTEQGACMDFLHAGQALAQERGLRLSGELFLSGFSQGGHATLALLQGLEAANIQVQGASAIAAMVDMPFCLGHLLRSSLPVAPVILAKAVLAAWRCYPQLEAMESPFVPEMRERAESLLFKRHTREQIFSTLALPLEQVFAASFLEEVRNGTHPLLEAVRAESIKPWLCRTPLRLYYGSADLLIQPENSLSFARTVQQMGGFAESVLCGAYSHNGCVPTAMVETALWFESLRQKRPAMRGEGSTPCC